MTKRSDNPADIGVHVFERAGLGKAPFRCIGMEEKVYKCAPDAPAQPAGTCDYCGMGIRYVYIVAGVGGKAFGVGCDCVAKTGDAGLIKSYKTLPEVRTANRDKARAKDDRVIAEWNSLIDANRDRLASIMVPGRPWVPGEQVSLLDDLKRAWSLCGASGRARKLKALKSRLSQL